MHTGRLLSGSTNFRKDECAGGAFFVLGGNTLKVYNNLQPGKRLTKKSILQRIIDWIRGRA